MQNIGRQTKGIGLLPISENTMLQCTIAGGRRNGADERSFVFVHQHGGDDVM